jgi:TatD DNase family protein
MVELVSLNAAEGGAVQAHGCRSALDAESDPDPRLAHIAGDESHCPSGPDACAISASFVRRYNAEFRCARFAADHRGYDPAVRLIDSHCHLNAERFAGEEEAVLERARAAGVERILVPGWNVASCDRALELVERFTWLDASVGVHPHDAAKVDDAGWRRIVEQAIDPRVVAIGETGLDYDRVFSPIPEQLTNLRRNLELALEIGMPAIIHVRSRAGTADAQDAIVNELESLDFGGQRAMSAFGPDRPPAVIHSFSGSVDYARRVLDLGLAISISGLAFRSGEEATADVAPIVPAERLLVETDSPFLSPPGAPRSRNEPEWVRITADWVASHRSEPAESMGEALVDAYDRTFRSRS